MRKRHRFRLVSAVGVLVVALSACGPDERHVSTPTAPVDTSYRHASQADPSQPVSSGNTPTAADIAAIAALNAQYDPARNPFSDLQTAKIEAQRGGRRIVLEVGGRWCDVCGHFDDRVTSDPRLRSFRDAHFVWVKINYSDENPNRRFLAQWPILRGFPHLFVLDAQGHLLASQSMSAFVVQQGIDRRAVSSFLQRWGQQALPARINALQVPLGQDAVAP